MANVETAVTAANKAATSPKDTITSGEHTAVNTSVPFRRNSTEFGINPIKPKAETNKATAPNIRPKLATVLANVPMSTDIFEIADIAATRPAPNPIDTITSGEHIAVNTSDPLLTQSVIFSIIPIRPNADIRRVIAPINIAKLDITIKKRLISVAIFDIADIAANKPAKAAKATIVSGVHTDLIMSIPFCIPSADILLPIPDNMPPINIPITEYCATA